MSDNTVSEQLHHLFKDISHHIEKALECANVIPLREFTLEADTFVAERLSDTELRNLESLLRRAHRRESVFSIELKQCTRQHSIHYLVVKVALKRSMFD